MNNRKIFFSPLIWILLTLIILLITIKFYQKPPQEKPTISFFETVVLPGEITYDTIPQIKNNIIPDSLPQEITIYKLNNKIISMQKIAEKFNFTGPKKINKDPLFGTQEYWTNESKSLIWEPSNYLLEYKHNILLDKSPLQKPKKSPEIVAEAMQNLLFDLNYNKNININDFVYTKIINDEEQEVSDINEADLIRTTWTSNINTYEVKNYKQTNTINYIRTTKSGEIISFSLNLITENAIPIGSVALKTKNEIINDLNNKKATFSETNLNEEDYQKNSKIDQIEINSINIEYYFFKKDDRDAYLLPIYIFPANLILNTGEQRNGELWLPALKESN